MDNHDNANNHPEEPYNAEDDASLYLIDNPSSYFSYPSPTLTLPPSSTLPPPSSQNISCLTLVKPTASNNPDIHDDTTESVDGKESTNDEENNAGQEAGGGNSNGAGPSGTKELGFRHIKQNEINCRDCRIMCIVFDTCDGLYDMSFKVHSLSNRLHHMTFEVHPSDPRVNNGVVDHYYMDFGGYDLDKVNENTAKYAMQIDENGTIHFQSSLLDVYNKILGGLLNSGQLLDRNNNNNPEPTPQLSSDSLNEGAGEADGDLNNEIGNNQNINDLNVVQQVYPWMVERAESSSSDSDDGPEERPSVAVQRERTARWTLLDLAPYFHLKADQASRKLKVCPTTLKIVCRKLHLHRWPYRKICSIDNKICGLKRGLQEKTEQGDVYGVVRLRKEIEREKQKRVQLYLFLTGTRTH